MVYAFFSPSFREGTFTGGCFCRISTLKSLSDSHIGSVGSPSPRLTGGCAFTCVTVTALDAPPSGCLLTSYARIVILNAVGLTGGMARRNAFF